MEPTSHKMTVFGAPFSESKRSRLILHLRQATFIGFSATALLMLAFPAQGDSISFTNGSFETTTGNTSSFVLGSSNTPDNWTFMGGIGCVVFPSTTNACGSNFASLYSWTTSPDGGKFVAIDGGPGYQGLLSQTISGLVSGQSYEVSFYQAAAQFQPYTGDTTEQWLVSFNPPGSGCDPTDPTKDTNPPACEHQYSTLMNNPSQGFVPWMKQSMIFIAQAATEVLSFFAVGTPAGYPPVVLLDGVSVTAQDNIIEVCKASSTTNSVPANGIYSFTVTGSAFSSGQFPLKVPVGECSGPISVAPNGGTVTITELPMPGVGVSAITASGYEPPPSSRLVNRLESYNLQARTATVIVKPPATAGDTSLQTLVTFTNYEAPPAELKVCKIAGTGVAVGTFFNFMIPGFTGTIPIQAGPTIEGGYCTLIFGTFQVGTAVTVTETAPAGNAVPAITVNGVSTPGTGCTPSTSAPFLCSVVAAIGPGINEVSFTNCSAQGGQFCRTGIVGENEGHFAIVNYSLVSQEAATGTQSYATYQADLLNTGTDVGPLMARLTSLDPSSVQVMGEGALNFESVPADSQVTSSNTFTILIDSTVPFDFSKLNWTFHSRRSVPPRRR